MDEKILVIEDDEAIRRVLQRALTFESYRVELAPDGLSGLALAQDQHPDLIILDLMLPGMDGLEVCEKLRRMTSSPILILTAKDQLEDKISGLDAGADDYVVKPFEIEELLARVRAMLRRTAADRDENLKLADLVLDAKTRQAFRGERAIRLTAKEYDLLNLFMSYPGQVMTREMIFDRVWDYTFGGESNVLDVYIRYLRQKLEENGEPRLIYTLRGVGYLMHEPD
jgi:two-component system response regulator MprA